MRNEADQLVFTTEKTLKELQGKVDEAEVKKANEIKDALKEAIDKNDFDQIKAKKEELQEIVQNLSVKLYEEAAKQAQTNNQQNNSENKNKNDDDVIDAEYKEVDDK